MPRKPPPKMITAWSFSRYTVYNQCARKAKYQIIDKLPITTNEAMQRGDKVHKDSQKFVTGTIRTLPTELDLFDDEFRQLAKMFKSKGAIKIYCELQWAFKRDWSICEWFAKQAWCRVIIDCFVLNEKARRATVIDYKTGKIREGYEEQLELYAGATFAKYPQLDEVQAELWFLDQGEIIERLYERDEADNLIVVWTKRVKPMLVDQRFAPKPSYLCQWCDFSQAKGGPCEY